MVKTLSDAQLKKAFSAAKAARKNAHAPYSHYNVGAGLLVEGDVVGGCNVENASYGATICAERNAILQAVARFGKVPFEGIVVMTGENPPAPPCALCLQVMSEFCDKDFPIYLADSEKIRDQVCLGDLLPRPFNSFKANED